MSFEDALELLERSVAQLESGELKLEQALQVFEQGVSASRACAKWLEETRQRVQVLTTEADGQFRLEAWEEAGPATGANGAAAPAAEDGQAASG